MKKIKSFLVAAIAMAFVAPMFIACGDDDKSDTVESIVSEYTINDQMVANQKAKSGKNVAVLLVAFGSTWNCLPGLRQDQGCLRGCIPQCRRLYVLLQRHLHQPRQCR